MNKMLILRGILNLLDENSAKEYARLRGFEPEVLDISGETGPNSEQAKAAIKALKGDPGIKALYGFSGGGYNVRHILKGMRGKGRLDEVVVIGAPNNPKELYEGDWRLVYRTDPKNGDHMAGPKLLVEEYIGHEEDPSVRWK